MSRKTKVQKIQGEREVKITKSLKFLQDKKFEMFQQISGLIDVSFVEAPEPVILIKTIAEIDVMSYKFAEGAEVDFEVKVLEAKDNQGKPVVVTDSGLENMKLAEGEEKKPANDFITVGVDAAGKTNMLKIPGIKTPADVTLDPEDMVFKPGDNH